MYTSPRHRLKRQQTSPDLIADELRSDIQRGVVAPGHPLRQEELARRFGVSRLPIRDALLRLEGEGLVAVYPNRGAYVASLSADEVREIYDLRVLLEGDLLARAVPLITTADWRRIDVALAEAADGAHEPEWATLDRAFHLALYTPARRTRQLALVETLRGTVDRYWNAYAVLPSRTTEWLLDHERLVAAARRGDAAEARRILTEHLRRAGDLVLAHLELSAS